DAANQELLVDLVEPALIEIELSSSAQRRLGALEVFRRSDEARDECFVGGSCGEGRQPAVDFRLRRTTAQERPIETAGRWGMRQQVAHGGRLGEERGAIFGAFQERQCDRDAGNAARELIEEDLRGPRIDLPAKNIRIDRVQPVRVLPTASVDK